MTGLLDTHTLLWIAENNPKLSPVALAFINDPANDLALSAATVWEIAVKVRTGKLALIKPYVDFINDAFTFLRLRLLPVNVTYAAVLTTLPLHHRDPFDRLMIAQAMTDQMAILSADAAFDAYPITRIW